MIVPSLHSLQLPSIMRLVDNRLPAFKRGFAVALLAIYSAWLPAEANPTSEFCDAIANHKHAELVRLHNTHPEIDFYRTAPDGRQPFSEALICKNHYALNYILTRVAAGPNPDSVQEWMRFYPRSFDLNYVQIVVGHLQLFFNPEVTLHPYCAFITQAPDDLLEVFLHVFPINPHLVDPHNGRSLLHYACYYGRASLALRLLAGGANIALPSPIG